MSTLLRYVQGSAQAIQDVWALFLGCILTDAFHVGLNLVYPSLDMAMTNIHFITEIRYENS